MRAYFTAAGMALGLVAIWADAARRLTFRSGAESARAFCQGPCGADSTGVLRQARHQ